jgi:DNA-binding FadR family transcriptional regulator
MERSPGRPTTTRGRRDGSPDADSDFAPVAELFAPLRLRNASEQVAERLVTALALGAYVPGQRLPTERDLAATLGVSRTTVRLGLSMLASTGYIDIRRGRHGGAFVLAGRGPDTDEMIRRTLVRDWSQFEQLFDFRSLVEGLIAHTAARRRTAEDSSLITAALEAYRGAGSDREASSAADRALHHAIANATHNRYLVDLSERLRHGATLGFRAEAYSPEIRQRAIGEHGELAEAVLAADADLAGAIAARHFTTTESRLRDLHEQALAASPEAQP